MKDQLTPNLSEGWKHWAESGQTQLFGLGLLVGLNIYLCVRIGLSACYNRKEKQFWFASFWLFPIVAHAFFLHHSWETRKARLTSNQTIAEGGIENDKAQDS